MSLDKKKRYHLVIPQDLYDELQLVADKRQEKVIDVLKKYIKYGLWFESLLEKPDTKLFIKEGGDRERELVFLG